MHLYGFLAVGCGAALGAWLRWGLSTWLNASAATGASVFPVGTFVANMLGAYSIGVAMAFFMQSTQLSDEIRLFFVVGLLGSLTTFSTFSLEVVSMLNKAQYVWALSTVALHVLGSLLLTVAGIATFHFFEKLSSA